MKKNIWSVRESELRQEQMTHRKRVDRSSVALADCLLWRTAHDLKFSKCWMLYDVVDPYRRQGYDVFDFVFVSIFCGYFFVVHKYKVKYFYLDVKRFAQLS